ncbi:hypothetical protein [Sandarakinorhabdus sp.]|uniref:hypothetical protein n=1 Tax=Sandarakinorhabdus sp. TaxID=1916663 RepID=UPI003341987E
MILLEQMVFAHAASGAGGGKSGASITIFGPCRTGRSALVALAGEAGDKDKREAE